MSLRLVLVCGFFRGIRGCCAGRHPFVCSLISTGFENPGYGSVNGSNVGYENPEYGSVNGSNVGYENPEYGTVGPGVPNPDFENPVYESVDDMPNLGENQLRIS